MPSRVLGCPGPRASRDEAAARRGRAHRCTLHVSLSVHGRSGPRYFIESEHADGPGRKRAAFALAGGPAMLPHRHAIDANPVTTQPPDVRVLFFFYDKT